MNRISLARISLRTDSRKTKTSLVWPIEEFVERRVPNERIGELPFDSTLPFLVERDELPSVVLFIDVRPSLDEEENEDLHSAMVLFPARRVEAGGVGFEDGGTFILGTAVLPCALGRCSFAFALAVLACLSGGVGASPSGIVSDFGTQRLEADFVLLDIEVVGVEILRIVWKAGSEATSNSYSVAG